jgi:hypothetical protein
MELEQRIMVKFLMRESLDANQILARLQMHFGKNAYASRTIRFWIAEFRRGGEDSHDEHRSGRPPLDDRNSGILAIIGKCPFEFACSIGQMLDISRRAALHRLHETFSIQIVSFAMGSTSPNG